MKDKIEVNEYVRTKNGLIEKIKEFIPHYTKGKREGQEVEENFLLMGQEQCKFIESIDYRIPPCYPSDEEWEKIKKYIVKHSKQLIDLIEVGDIIKYRIDNISTTLETKGYIKGIVDISDEEMLQRIKSDKNYNILEILTREQYMANCFKVGGEDE